MTHPNQAKFEFDELSQSTYVEQEGSKRLHQVEYSHLDDLSDTIGTISENSKKFDENRIKIIKD